MEKRLFKRIIVRLGAEIISRAESYPGFLEIPTEFDGVSFYNYAGIIENLSEDGMMITVPENTGINFKPGSTIEIGFQLPSGERLILHCEVKWFKTKTSRRDSTHCIGLKIIDPPPIYNGFLKAELNQIK